MPRIQFHTIKKNKNDNDRRQKMSFNTDNCFISKLKKGKQTL